jgi:uncharacterized membrane protein
MIFNPGPAGDRIIFEMAKVCGDEGLLKHGDAVICAGVSADLRPSGYRPTRITSIWRSLNT